MPLQDEAVTVGIIDDSKPITDVKASRPRTVGETTFNLSVALILGAWVALGLLYWSLRKYNI